MKPAITVIIPARNEEQYIELCLSALEDQDYEKDMYEIIVVDNNSKDQTKYLVQRHNSVKYLYSAKGPVGAVRNLGLAEAKGELIAFIDADCVAPKNWLSIGAKLLLENENCAFSGRYIADGSSKWIEKLWLLGYRSKRFESTDFLGGCIFVRRSDIQRIGGFNENITSGEDTKLAMDLRSVGGINTIIDQSLNVIHLGNAKGAVDFIKRQVWHSENYIKNIKLSIKDPTFILTLVFTLTLVISAAIPIMLGSFSKGTILFPLTAFSCPALLSAKRIIRSTFRTKKLNLLIKIYIIDFCYLVGRSIGLLKGILCLSKNKRLNNPDQASVS